MHDPELNEFEEAISEPCYWCRGKKKRTLSAAIRTVIWCSTCGGSGLQRTAGGLEYPYSECDKHPIPPYKRWRNK